MHGELQSPALQLVLLVPEVEQARPHAPQFCASEARMASQPLSGAGAAGWVQFPNPFPQVELHSPAEHVRLAVFA